MVGFDLQTRNRLPDTLQHSGNVGVGWISAENAGTCADCYLKAKLPTILF